MGIPLDHIKRKIEVTGFPTEMRAVQELLRQQWKTVHSTSFEDLDEGKSREIDALAAKFSSLAEQSYVLNFHIVVEAKHSELPWVCFSSPRAYVRTPWSIVHATNTRSYTATERKMESLPFFSGHCAQDEFLRTGHLRIARAFHEVGLDSQDEGAPQNSRKQKPQEGKPRILEGLRQVTKAAHFFAKQNQAKFNEDVRKPLYLASMDVFHPVLIVDSELFEAHLKEDGEMDIQSQPWMPVEITYSSPLYREGPWGNSYFPDIVTLSAWPDYLSRVEQWRLAMIAKMNEEISHQRNLPPRPRNRIVIKSKASEGTTFTGR